MSERIAAASDRKKKVTFLPYKREPNCLGLLVQNILYEIIKQHRAPEDPGPDRFPVQRLGVRRKTRFAEADPTVCPLHRAPPCLLGEPHRA